MGLKQSPHQWNKRFDGFVASIGFKKSRYDSCLYFKGSTVEDMVLFVYLCRWYVACEQGEMQGARIKEITRFPVWDEGSRTH